MQGFADDNLLFPTRVRIGANKGESAWMPLSHWRVLRTLHNPRCAGAFVFGRHRWKMTPGGTPSQQLLPREQWTSLILDAHPGYISFAIFDDNQLTLLANAQAHGADRSAGPAREGPALLQDLIVCGRCKRRLGYLVATGRNGGKYDYFFYYGRQAKNGCDLPFLTTTAVEEAVTHAYGDIELGSELAEEVRGKLLGALKRSTAGLERERKRRTERVNDLKNQRRRLVQGHLAGVIPMDLVKEERERIEIELYDAEQQLLETAVDWDTVEINLTLAMGLVSDCQQAYRRGGPRVRRRYNQAFWEAIFVDVDGVSCGRLATPFHQVLPSKIMASIETTDNPDAHRRDRGLSKNDVVVLPCHSTRRTARARSSAFAHVEGPVLQLPPLGTALRQDPGAPLTHPTDRMVGTLPVQRRLGPDEVAQLVAAYRHAHRWRHWRRRLESTGRRCLGTSIARRVRNEIAGRFKVKRSIERPSFKRRVHQRIGWLRSYA